MVKAEVVQDRILMTYLNRCLVVVEVEVEAEDEVVSVVIHSAEDLVEILLEAWVEVSILNSKSLNHNLILICLRTQT